MARLTCPYCARKVKVPQYVVGAVIRCPGCSQVYQVMIKALSPLGQAPTAQPAAEDPTLPPPPPTPLLTASHQCQHCGSSLHTPVGRSAATVCCPSCHHQTSVYAVLHACPSCGHPLESPSRVAGTETTCPACAKSLWVPSDVLLKEAPVYSDDFRFGFFCPACSGEVVAREEDVGVYAVCPHCTVPLVVPNAGHHPEGVKPSPARDLLASLHVSKEVACPKCGTRFPGRASACPVCGARTTSPPQG